MKNYLDALRNCKDNGVNITEDRTGIGRRKIFGQQLRWLMADGLPVMTTKKVFLKSVIHELIWLISGSTNIEYLVQNGVGIWTEWPFKSYLKANGLLENYTIYNADKTDFSDQWKTEIKSFAEKISTDHEFAKQYGDLGPTYGKQWRNFDGVDQLVRAQELLRTNPNSTRIIISAWNAKEATQVELPPCHTFYQFNSFVNSEGKRALVLEMYMRSADAFLGVPFNIASYAILLNMMAQTTNHIPHELIIHFNDFHIYLNHFEAVETQLQRQPKTLPSIKLNPEVKDIRNFKYEDIEVIDYNPDPYIKAPVAI
jgi:thymidylate synthase